MSDETDEDKGGVLELLKTIVYALLIAGVIRTVLIQPNYIPSGSMKPTILINDFVFINKWAYGYSSASCPFEFMCPFEGRIFHRDPERGDIAVFVHPVSGVVFIKRVIGLPRDRIQIRDGQIFIDRREVEGDEFEAVPQEQIDNFVEPNLAVDTQQCIATLSDSTDCVKERFAETLDDTQFETLNSFPSVADNTRIFEVPPGHYFFMGDNRDNSVDSRARRPRGLEMVPADRLIGKAEIVLFSSAGSSIFFFWRWRPDRFFKWVE